MFYLNLKYQKIVILISVPIIRYWISVEMCNNTCGPGFRSVSQRHQSPSGQTELRS